MITFKELNKKNEISDIELGSISLLNAKSLYDVFKTDKNILHLFYNGSYDFTSIDVIFELMEYDKVILDFSGADDFLLRFYDMDNVKSKIKAKEIIIISKNIFEKPGYIYNDPIMHRIKILDFFITNDIKNYLYFFLGGHARWHRLLFLNKLLKINVLSKLNWSLRRVEEETPSMVRSCIPLEYINLYKDLEIHKYLPKSLDFDIHNQAEYHNFGDASIFDNPGYVANLDFYHNSYIEIISESVFELAINPAKKDKEYFIVSEKTFKPLALGFPFIGLTLPKTFAKLKEWGFELFNELIDYSFDDEYDDNKRMDIIIEQISNNNIKENFNIHFESIKEKHLHNRKMFLELKERLLKNYEKNII
jgi:hypothetical protein